MQGTFDWHPRHDDPLFILALDHRESFGTAARASTTMPAGRPAGTRPSGT
jgi:hypothetical protein